MLKDFIVPVVYALLVAGGIVIGIIAGSMFFVEATSVELFPANDDDEELMSYATVSCLGFVLAAVALVALLRPRSTQHTDSPRKSP